MVRRGMLVVAILGSLAGCVWLGARTLAEQDSAGRTTSTSSADANDSRPVDTQPVGANEVHVTILHVADTHGRLGPYRKDGNSVGGWARLAARIAEIRKQSKADRVLLVHAGDILSRGDRTTRRTRGAANIHLMNRLGFDFLTPGNGEYYDGLDVLTARIKQAKFAVLTSNVVDESTGKPLGTGQVVVNVEGAKIALFGICMVRKGNRKGLEYTDAIPAATRLVPKLRKRADLVVAVTHIGYQPDLLLASAVDGIDVILGGHTHTLLERGTVVPRLVGRSTLIAHAGEYVQHLGQVDIELRRTGSTYRVESARATVHRIDDSIEADPAIEKLIRQMSKRDWSPPKESQTDRSESQPAAKRTNRKAA
jgi:2',3'-cyclic-nucleotide 2'-phosphodiesterase (5'-nucleotidase family)